MHYKSTTMPKYPLLALSIITQSLHIPIGTYPGRYITEITLNDQVRTTQTWTELFQNGMIDTLTYLGVRTEDLLQFGVKNGRYWERKHQFLKVCLNGIQESSSMDDRSLTFILIKYTSSIPSNFKSFLLTKHVSFHNVFSGSSTSEKVLHKYGMCLFSTVGTELRSLISPKVSPLSIPIVTL